MTLQYAGVPQLNAHEFAWCGNAAPLLDAKLEELVAEAVNKITGVCGLVGINGIDFIEHEGVPYLIEVNPRYPSSTELLERLRGVNALALHMQACEGRLPVLKPLKPASGSVGKGILYARETVHIHGTDGWSNFELADIPHEDEVIQAGDPVCSVFASGVDVDDCWKKVLMNAAELERIIYL
jgi:predicted ATP-grasp superfamily ATP-dependent carboligase